jgi:broad specificity phosphatase PhoE
MRRLILVRHGETEANQRHALDSRPPGGPLTAEGERQAQRLAADLAGEPVVAVYASTAIRAQATARPVAVRHGLTVEVAEDLHEVFVGDLECRTDRPSFDAFLAVFHSWAGGDLERSMPGGESAVEVIDRFAPTVRKLADRHAEGTVVFVSHGAAIRLVAPFLCDGVNLDQTQYVLLPNTGRVVLVADRTTPTGWRCVEWAGINLSETAGSGRFGSLRDNGRPVPPGLTSDAP